MGNSKLKNNPALSARSSDSGARSGILCQMAYSSSALSDILCGHFGLRNPARFIVAYSGGCDSQVLLNSLTDAVRGTECDVIAAHYNHQLQMQSESWVESCRHWAESLGVDFVTNQQTDAPENGENIEAWARKARYQWLSGIAHEGDVILTAHHANDQAETFLMNLFQGRSIAQLSGISPCRSIVFGSTTRLIRPLLGFTRGQLHEYAQKHNLNWIEDPSNDSISSYRNFLRHELIPVLHKRSSNFLVGLNNAADNCRKIYEREIEYFARLCRHGADPGARRIFCLTDPLRLDSLVNSDQFEFNGLIRYWLHESGCASPGNRKLSEFHRQIHRSTGNSQLQLKRYVIRKYNAHLYLTGVFTEALTEKLTAPKNWNNGVIRLTGHNISIRTKIMLNQGLDPSFVEDAQPKWAWRKGGERMILPARTHSTSLKKLWQSSQVPPWEREHLPMLMVDGEIAWVWGVGVSNRFAVAPGNRGVCPHFSSASD